MIIDNHAHSFPHLGSNSEYEKEGIQLLYAQKLISDHIESARKLKDYSLAPDNTLWDKNKPGPEGRFDVNFRTGKYGKYEWTYQDDTYFKQYMPVGMQEMVAPPDFLIAQMNYAGIDKAVLQRGHIYGKVDKYYENALKKYPDRFIGLTQIDEAEAYKDEQIDALHNGINKLGLKGLYFEPGALFMNNFKYNFDNLIYDTFWKEVELLNIPVYIQTDRNDYLNQIKSWIKILEKCPSIVLVITLGLPKEVLESEDQIHVPELVKHLVKEFNVYLEIAYPISMGNKVKYPYREAHRLIELLYMNFGPEKLVWGTDIPNIERYCTYRQSLYYIIDYCKFLSDEDKEQILAENVLKIFNLK